MRIWKWEIEIIDRQTLMMPVGAKILTVQMQKDKCYLWALCDTEGMLANLEPRHLGIYSTNNPMDYEQREYIATIQSHGGDFIWHVFEVFK